jgi:hypothetical protein
MKLVRELDRRRDRDALLRAGSNVKARAAATAASSNP